MAMSDETELPTGGLTDEAQHAPPVVPLKRGKPVTTVFAVLMIITLALIAVYLITRTAP
jgi:hypothetical protein